MITQVARTGFLSLGVGFLCQLSQNWLASQYLSDFLRENLINILIALLAVNSATMAIVLTKIRELVETHGHGDVFDKTQKEFLLAVREQVGLIGVAIVVLTMSHSRYIANVPYGDLLSGALIDGVFVYSMTILYDISKSILIILGFDPESDG